jgi:hypothetical protein
MQAYLDLLTDFFKNKNSFRLSIQYYTSQNYPISPSQAIVELDKLGYEFTQKDFDKFTTCASHNKSNSYIVTKGSKHYYHKDDDDAGNPYDYQQKAIKIMFTKFTPSDKQFNLLMSCYNVKQGYRINQSSKYWIDILVGKNHVFTIEQKQQLIKIDYDIGNIYNDDNNLTIDEIKTITESVFNNKTQSSKLLQIVKKNKLQYPEDFIDWLLEHYKQNYSYRSDYNNEFTTIFDIFLKQKKIKLNEKIIDTITDKQYHITLIIYFLDNGLKPNEKLIDYCATNANCKTLILRLHKTHNIEITTQLMNKMLDGEDFINYQELLRNIGYPNNTFAMCEYTEEEEMDEESDESGEAAKPYKKPCKKAYKKPSKKKTKVKDEEKPCRNFSDFMIKYNIKPDEETFKIACSRHNENLFDHCTEKYKMIPNKEHLRLSLDTADDGLGIINKILCYKIIPEKEHLESICLSYNYRKYDIIELFIKFGYVLDMDDLNMLLRYDIIINNLERFNIKYDEKLYYLCHINDTWYPSEKFEFADKRTLDLRLLCMNSVTTIENYEEYVKENNIEPDGYCLEHACRYNKKLALHLINTLNYIPTLSVFYWLNPKSEAKEIYHKMIKIHKIDDEYLSKKLIKL